jgi:Tol biopolymer transport system component
MSLLGLCLLSGLDTPHSYADFTFGEPVNLKEVIPAIDPAIDYSFCFSLDGLEMYIGSDRSGGYGWGDLWVFRRDSIDADWGSPNNLGSTANSPDDELSPCISANGLELYFISNQPGGYGGMDIYMTTRATKNDPWGQPVHLPNMSSPNFDSCPWISSNGLEFYFQSNRPGGYGGFDIYVSRRATLDDPWDDPVNLGPVVNSSYNDAAPSLSPDGMLLFFQDFDTPRPGGYGGRDIWMARRASFSDPWEPPVNLGPNVNGPASVHNPRVSPDGSTLYFGSPGTNWQAPITPIVDLNGDGIVDSADMCIMVDNWGTDEPLCDIGPMPWGDGIVDVQDLIVLAEHLFEEVPLVE